MQVFQFIYVIADTINHNNEIQRNSYLSVLNKSLNDFTEDFSNYSAFCVSIWLRFFLNTSNKPCASFSFVSASFAFSTASLYLFLSFSL